MLPKSNTADRIATTLPVATAIPAVAERAVAELTKSFVPPGTRQPLIDTFQPASPTRKIATRRRLVERLGVFRYGCDWPAIDTIGSSGHSVGVTEFHPILSIIPVIGTIIGH